MSISIHLDSAYVGFIFLIVTELVIIKIVVDSHLRNLDRNIKRALDKGESVDIELCDYGPLRVNRKMSRKKMAMMVFPAALILILIALGEIGISGRTIDTSSKENTIVAGGYFSLFSGISSVPKNLAPLELSTKWCVNYEKDEDGKDVISVNQLTVTYDIDEFEDWDLGIVSCAKDIGMTVMTSLSDCYFLKEEAEMGELVFWSHSYNTDDVWTGTSVFSGKGVLACSSIHGKYDNVTYGDYTSFTTVDDDLSATDDDFSTTDDDDFSTTVDDSLHYVYNRRMFTVMGDDKKERNIVDMSEPGEQIERWYIRTDVFIDSIVVECESGCLEAIVEWLSLDSGISIKKVNNLISIWYEGLDYYKFNDKPECYEQDEVWSDIFKRGSCEEAVGEQVVLDGGQENITVVSIWALSIIIIGCVFTCIYWFMSREDGYDLLSYEGICKTYYVEVNPDNIWVGGGICLKFVNGFLSAKQNFGIPDNMTK